MRREGDSPGELDIGMHQPQCIHRGGSTVDQLKYLVNVQSRVNWQQLDSDRIELRRRVAAYCGLAGVIPDWKRGVAPAGMVTFDKMRAIVSVSISNATSSTGVKREREAEGGGRSMRMLPLAETLEKGPDERLVEINRSQGEVVRFLQQATTRFCNAATIIQKSKSCCNSFTLIVSRKPTAQLSAVVDMVSISFRSLKALRDSLLALGIQPLEHGEFVRLKDIQKCSAIGERLLGIFGYAIISNESDRGLIQFSPLDCHLQVLSLATQLLGLGLVFYTQGHLGPLSPFFLARPLTEMLLLGIGNDSLYLKASLRDLACLGEMLGGPVFAFELISANKLSPDVVQLDTTKAVSLEKFEVKPDSSVLPDSPPLLDPTYELLSRIVDIVDSWGPALLISEPGASYGKQIYAIEIGGGIIKAADLESKKVDSPIPELSLIESGIAYATRIHDIADLIVDSKPIFFLPQSQQNYLEPIEKGDRKFTRVESESEENSANTVETGGDGIDAAHPERQADLPNQDELNGGGMWTSQLRSAEGHLNMPLFHWSPRYASYEGLKTRSTFSCWDWLQIGAISTNMDCPLSPNKYRKQSQQHLSNLGTQPDFWELSERQVAFQAGYYTIFQVGNTYARKLGKTIKQQIIEQWSMFPNIHNLDVHWGLQISLCTGIAKRVSLLHLIQDSLLIHVDLLKYEQWHKMLPNARAAFRGSIDIDSWVEELNSDEKTCLISIIAYVLSLLNHTGLDREGKSLSVLWPHPPNVSYGVKVPCDRKLFWARMMQDTDSCATFAAVTSVCLEGHHHSCRKMVSPPWLENTVFLSTAVCRDLTTMGIAPKSLDHWRLEEGKRYWIGKVGGDCWVLVRRNNKGEPQLFVRGNRFPKALSHTFWKLDVLRERPDASFEAEEVIVF